MSSMEAGSGIVVGSTVAVNVAENGVSIGRFVNSEATLCPSKVAENVPVKVSTFELVLVFHM